MLKQFKDNLEVLDNKTLVDTVYSLGRLHNHQDQERLNAYGDFKFFQHLFEESLQEITARLDQLTIMQLTYLSKGLVNLRHLFSAENRDLDNRLCEAIQTKCLAVINSNSARFDPYSISKLMRYFSRHTETKDTLTLYAHFAKELVRTVSQRQISLFDADLDDALVDLELHDVVDIIKVMAPLSKKLDKGPTSVPRLFDLTKPQYQQEVESSEDQYLRLY